MGKNGRGEITLRQIQHWEKRHLRSHTKVNYALTVDLLKNNGMDSDFRRYILSKEYTFVSDSARTFSLGVFGETVKNWLQNAEQQINIFHERQAMRRKLDKVQRADSLYDQMEQVFYGVMTQFLQMISFFQYDRIADPVYREFGNTQIMRILAHAQQLLDYYGSYLTMQGTAGFTNSAEEIANIQIAVESMQETLRQVGGRG